MTTSAVVSVARGVDYLCRYELLSLHWRRSDWSAHTTSVRPLRFPGYEPVSDFDRGFVRIGQVLRMLGFEPDVAITAAEAGVNPKRAYADYLRENQTTSERMMARVLYYLGCDVEPQQVVRGYIVDFLDREGRIVIEVDGSSHSGKEDYDAERDAIMRADGYRVIRIQSWEVPLMLQQVARWRSEAA